MTDDELRAIEERMERHNSDGTCLSMMARCEVGSGEIAERLLAELKRIRAEIARHNEFCTPECYEIK